MATKTKKYIIARGMVLQLTDQVNQLLSIGWQLQGGVSSEQNIYAQALYKEFDDEQDIVNIETQY